MSKLTLKTETVRTLSGDDLDAVVGGLGHIKNPYETNPGAVRNHKHKVQPTKTAHTPPLCPAPDMSSIWEGGINM